MKEKIWGWNPSLQEFEECDRTCMIKKQWHNEHVVQEVKE